VDCGAVCPEGVGCEMCQITTKGGAVSPPVKIYFIFFYLEMACLVHSEVLFLT